MGTLGVVAIIVGLSSESTLLQVSRIGAGALILVATGALMWLFRPAAEKASCLILTLVFGATGVLALTAFVLFFLGEFVGEILS